MCPGKESNPSNGGTVTFGEDVTSQLQIGPAAGSQPETPAPCRVNPTLAGYLERSHVWSLAGLPLAWIVFFCRQVEGA